MRALGLILVGVGLVAGPVLAQDPPPRRTAVPVEEQRHRGFWLGFGLGGGWERFDFDFGNRGRGGAAYLRMGGTINQHFLFGGEVATWFRDDGSSEVERVNLTATALLYPGSHGGWFMKAGGGVASLERDGDDLRNGIAATLGTGYDIRLGSGNLYLTPNVDVLVQFFSDATPASLVFTLGVGWH